jgi:hypothetical protein
MTWPIVFLIVALVVILCITALLTVAIMAVGMDRGPAKTLYRDRRKGATHGD